MGELIEDALVHDALKPGNPTLPSEVNLTAMYPVMEVYSRMAGFPDSLASSTSLVEQLTSGHC
jgi:hypothetical protein